MGSLNAINIRTPLQGEWILVVAHISKNYFRSDQEETTPDGTLDKLKLQNVGTIVAISTAVSFVMYTFLAGGLHWYYHVQRRDKNDAIGNKMFFLISCAINLGSRYTSLYYKISDRSLLHFIVSIPLVFLFNECAGYYSHRMFHIPVLYKTIHKWHHRYHQPTPLAATAMHPLEFLTYQAYYAAPAFIFPVHVGVYITVLLYNYYYGIIDHSGINMEALWPWQPPSIYHDNHHNELAAIAII
ncbi:hypothetical protein KUTeg_010693 [Tegillarca granosa]|uniref:Fatty acid hydroxylase domain-containing protein n=1 Tax=Tegillarca granosa TaxID=220873 RepID=A0ABQ9F6W0_TEGGR|nr:hypothetical protein KUTeg_010693 [Tegillarca granosa]